MIYKCWEADYDTDSEARTFEADSPEAAGQAYADAIVAAEDISLGDAAVVSVRAPDGVTTIHTFDIIMTAVRA